MPSKRGQIAIFLVVGIIIFIVFIAYSIIPSSIKNLDTQVEESQNSQLFIIPIQTYVQSCFQNTARDGMKLLGLQGGYYHQPLDFVEISYHFVPIFFNFFNTTIPSIDRMEKELEDYIQDYIDICLDNLSDFRAQGYVIELAEPSFNVTFTERNIVLSMVYPITIIQDNKRIEINQFLASIPFNSNLIYDTIIEFKAEQEKLHDFIPIGGLTEIAHENNISFSVNYLTNGIVVYTLIFNNSKVSQEDYYFSFAGRYNWTIFPKNLSKVVTLDFIPLQEAYVDYEYYYKVKAKGDSLSFYDYTYLFNINQTTGEIFFTPTNTLGGKHFVLIGARDSQGNYDEQAFQLVIKNENNPPYIKYIQPQHLKPGEHFEFQIDATDPENQSLFFLDNTNLFNINIHTGLINFTPSVSQKGTYNINITVVDYKGLSYTRDFEMVIS